MLKMSECKHCGEDRYYGVYHYCSTSLFRQEPIVIKPMSLRPLLGPGKMNCEEWARWGCRPPHWTDPIVRPIMERMNPPLRWR